MQQAGIMHCDLKPENVLMECNDPQKAGFVKVIDFGSGCLEGSAFHTYIQVRYNQQERRESGNEGHLEVVISLTDSEWRLCLLLLAPFLLLSHLFGVLCLQFVSPSSSFPLFFFFLVYLAFYASNLCRRPRLTPSSSFPLFFFFLVYLAFYASNLYRRPRLSPSSSSSSSSPSSSSLV